MTSFAQENSLPTQKFKFKNAFQLDLFGHGLIYSLNYERILINKERFKTTAQVGGSFYPKSVGFRALWLPIMRNQHFSFDKHHILVGLGHVLTKDNIKRVEPPASYAYLYDETEWAHIAALREGYRFQKPDSRFLFRVAFTHFFEYNKKAPYREMLFDFYPSGALTFGYNF